ncbi:ribonuclease H-like, partial [Pieris brassicae]|uniref:ribonuclease H-like n=1 Tax=Pieris brassicae TaxID=7116 RepID=UPI001E660A3F
MFTDGSKTPNGVGAAWVHIRDGVEVQAKKIKLAPYCTVYQAELAALRSATNHAGALKIKHIDIYSDSKASLEAITHGRSCNPQVVKIRRAIGEAEKRGQKINLHWLKAHIGTPGNERADELAKEAAEKLKTKPEYDKRPLSDVKRQIRRNTLEAWQKRYTKTHTGA